MGRRRAAARAVAPALVCAIAAGGCASARPATGSYPLIPTDERPIAISFFGVDSRREVVSTRSGFGRVQVVVYDAAPAATDQQVAVVRQARGDFRGVRLLRITLDGRQLRSHDVFYEGRPTADPRVVELHKQVFSLAAAGLPYSEIVDRQGRVAARLVGTSDVDRLTETVRRLLGGPS